MNIDLPQGSRLYADSAYTDYKFEDAYNQLEQIQLMVERKFNSKRPDSFALKVYKKHMRKRIEITFSEIIASFPRKIPAVTIRSSILKIVLSIFAYSLNRAI